MLPKSKLRAQEIILFVEEKRCKFSKNLTKVLALSTGHSVSTREKREPVVLVGETVFKDTVEIESFVADK